MTLLIRYLLILNLNTKLQLSSDAELHFIHKQMAAVSFTRAFSGLTCEFLTVHLQTSEGTSPPAFRCSRQNLQMAFRSAPLIDF